MEWTHAIEAALNQRRQANGFRQRRAVRVLDSTHVEVNGRACVNFASNNYLGLTHHPRMIEAFSAAAQSAGTGSGAAALVTGYTDAHASAECVIARWKGTESAVMLSSGYAANLAAVQTLAAIVGEGKVRFLLDKLCHASLIDAVRASLAPFRIFPHNDLNKLKRLLEEADKDQLQVVITESIFSMDGDAADLAGISTLKKSHDFLLLLDEAHASGVYGPDGSGYAAECGLQSIVDVSVVTLSKAIGVSGGAVCASRAFCDAVVNLGRSYIYSTNLPPAIAAAVEVAIDLQHTEPQRRIRLAALTRDFRNRITQLGLPTMAGDSPIIPIILRDETKALEAAERLLDAGLLVIAIRPPTVPRASSRLRITLSSEHREEEIKRLLEAVGRLQ